eukprot:SAG31_NODE_1334_length_8741_cov_4.311618_1_plen_163_part_00
MPKPQLEDVLAVRPLTLNLCEVYAEEKDDLQATISRFSKLKLTPLVYQLKRREIDTNGADDDKEELLRRLQTHLQRGPHAREVANVSPSVSMNMWKEKVQPDRNGDGSISEAEFAAWHMFKTGAPPGDADFKKFWAADADGDGNVSDGEFERYKLMHVKSVM